MKRGVIIRMPEHSRPEDVTTDLALRGFPNDPSRFQIETWRSFNDDTLLVKVRTYHNGEKWLPEVQRGAEYTQCSLDEFAEMVDGSSNPVGFTTK
jgi:hypothetical protein